MMDKITALEYVRRKLKEAEQRTFRSLYEEFQSLHLQCSRNTYCKCLVAEWLTHGLDGWWARVGIGWVDVVRPNGAEDEFVEAESIRLPKILQRFVGMFDGEALPEFDAAPCPGGVPHWQPLERRAERFDINNIDEVLV